VSEAPATAEAITPPPKRAAPSTAFTSETGREAAKRRVSQSQRMDAGSDADIERSLRKAAKSDPRAAEVLLRWLARPQAAPAGDELEALTMEQLERLHAALIALSMRDVDEQRLIVEGLLRAPIHAPPR